MSERPRRGRPPKSGNDPEIDDIGHFDKHDPLSFYFREIRQVPLLTTAQEAELGGRLELARRLDDDRTDLRRDMSEPSAWEVGMLALMRMNMHLDMFRSVCAHAEPALEPTIDTLLRSPRVGDLIDGALDMDLIRRICADTGVEPDDAHLGLVDISVSRRLLPACAHELVERAWHTHSEIGSCITYSCVDEKHAYENEDVSVLSDLTKGLHLHRQAEAYNRIFEKHHRGIEKSGARARDELAEANLRLVVSVARKFEGSGMALLDLVQEGNLGLMDGVDRFDHRKGFKFSTYCTWWIRQAITKALTKQGRLIRLPANVHIEVNKAAKAQSELSAELGRDPTDEEVSARIGVTVERVLELQKIGRDVVSLDESAGDDEDDGFSALSKIASPDSDPEASAVLSLLSEDLPAVMAELNPTWAKVLTLRYGLGGGHPHTLQEIGDAMGISRERARQMELRGLKALREPKNASRLHSYL